MTTLNETLWEVINNLVPLFQDDIDTFLTKEGYIIEEDKGKWNDAVKLIKEAYRNSFSSDAGAIEYVKKALNELAGISPKKPLPPEMKTRFEEIKTYLSSVLPKEISSTQ